ncbi:hypothetical protein [Sphingobium sp.]|uniref:hypothetical protein n=1 Tax=Sphingobium sp. TaxID=1912891 RepID=UPI00261543C9|nr:hypothetical protein [Sphingobium sp.]
MTDMFTGTGWPVRSHLIDEAALAVRQGSTKRAAGLGIYDRYYGSKFEDDEAAAREDRLRDLSKQMRRRLKDDE